LDNNSLCPPYPECLNENFIGFQNTSECCPIIDGDINNDSILDILDIVTIVNCVLSNTCEACTDINEDGQTDVIDIIQIANSIIE